MNEQIQEEIASAISLLTTHSATPVRAWHIGGSTAINGSGNDVDVITLQDNPLVWNDFFYMKVNGWELCGGESYNSCGMFMALRKGNVNLIIVENAEYYRCWEKARDVCIWLRMALGITDRDARVAIHRIVCDSEPV